MSRSVELITPKSAAIRQRLVSGAVTDLKELAMKRSCSGEFSRPEDAAGPALFTAGEPFSEHGQRHEGDAVELGGLVVRAEVGVAEVLDEIVEILGRSLHERADVSEDIFPGKARLRRS